MVEQNISGVKLERLRQNAVKKHKILRKLFPVCLILFIGLTLVKNRFCWEMGSIFLFTAPYPCPGAVSAPAGGVRCPQQISPGTASSNCLG